MYVCVCHGVSDRRLRETVQQGASSFEDLQAATGVGTCCGACEPMARALVEETLVEHLAQVDTAA